MDWQTTTAWCAIALAGAYLALRGWRTLRPKKDACSGGCGCAKTAPTDAPKKIIPSEELVVRQR